MTASIDGIAKVWDAQAGTELFTLRGHDGIVQIYTTDMEELLQIAESRVTRQLTAEEKEKYGVLDLN